MVGIVPVTLVNERSIDIEQRQIHAEYAGVVLFRNTFDGELPAVEYPKIGVSSFKPAGLLLRMALRADS
jgi:hypothetical protein